MPKLRKTMVYYSEALGFRLMVPKGTDVRGIQEEKARACGALPKNPRKKPSKLP